MQNRLDDDGPLPAIYAQRACAVASTSSAQWSTRVDVAVVGGGITGLSAAYHLAGAGASVAVYEAREIGWGASGRAFGQVVPSLKHSSEQILAYYGPERGERILSDIAAAPDLVFDLIASNEIACDAVRTGLLFAAHTPAGLRSLERRTAEWQRRGARIEMLDRAQTATAIGSGAYAAACLDHRGGHINPLGYVRGLARAALAAGAVLHTATPVCRLERRAHGWALHTQDKSVSADAVIIATNAHTGALWPGLGESIVPMRVHGAITKPLPLEVLHSILPGGQPLTDTRRLYSGIRKLPGGHLHVTTDGPAFGAGQLPYLDKARTRVTRLFAHLPELSWQEHWSGWIALTSNQLPHVHELGPGLYAALGYSGRGLAAATLMGRDLAARVRGAAESDVTFPLSPLSSFPARSLAPLSVGAVIGTYRLLDAVDEARARRA